MTFTPIPAIDVRQDRVVRLHQGDYARETIYGHSPLDCALDYSRAGAQWLHLVDLDAARSGGYTLAPLLRSITSASELNVQTGGGVRTQADVETLLAAGATRVVIGTVAVREPALVSEWLARFGAKRIVVALDARQDADGEWRLPVQGWTKSSSQSLPELLDQYADAGLQHLLCTDIARDGMLVGFNLSLYQMLGRRWPGLQIQASGGVRDLADIHAARGAGAAAAILGRALLERKFTMAQALAC